MWKHLTITHDARKGQKSILQRDIRDPFIIFCYAVTKIKDKQVSYKVSNVLLICYMYMLWLQSFASFKTVNHLEIRCNVFFFFEEAKWRCFI